MKIKGISMKSKHSVPNPSKQKSETVFLCIAFDLGWTFLVTHVQLYNCSD